MPEATGERLTEHRGYAAPSSSRVADRRSCAGGVDDPSWGQIIVAAVVPDGEASPDPASLRDFVRVQLRGSRTPDRVVIVAELPANASGKVLRRELEGIVATALGQPSH
jgi:acyl-CoA synthetase (AMP-forming)/AMP-acid ligase II